MRRRLGKFSEREGKGCEIRYTLLTYPNLQVESRFQVVELDINHMIDDDDDDDV
jgi:hypothetical protein